MDKYKDYSQRKVTVNGVDMTRYEASQAMRQAETKIRYQKEEIITLESAGIDTTKERSKLNDLQNGYIGICNQSGLKPKEPMLWILNSYPQIVDNFVENVNKLSKMFITFYELLITL